MTRAAVALGGLILFSLFSPLEAQHGVSTEAPPVPVVEGRVLELVEIVRIGTIEGADEYRFARISDVSVDPSAREVYVVDGLDRRIKVYNVAGRFQRAWGREGQGPGEFRGPLAIAVGRDTVVVADGDRVHAFTSHGKHIESVVPRASLRVTWAVDAAIDSSGWRLTLSEIEPGVTGSTPFRRTYRLRPDRGIDPVWLYQHPHPGPEASGIFEHVATSAIHRAGFIEAASPRFEIGLHDGHGSLVRLLRFEDEPIVVAESSRDDFEAVKRADCRQNAQPAICSEALENYLDEVAGRPLPRHRPVVGRLLGSQDGWILVQRADLDPSPFEPGDETAWDLVRDDGAWSGRINFPEDFRPTWLGDGEVWGIQYDQFDVPYVLGFRWTLG